MRFVWGKAVVFALIAVFQAINSQSAVSQNYERYKPLDLPTAGTSSSDLPDAAELPKSVEDDRVLVASLDAVIIVDHGDKIDTDESIDSLEGVHYRFDCNASLVHKQSIRSLLLAQLGKPVTLRQINELSRDIIKEYRRCKQPIVDVLIPEQRVTGGTLQIVVVEARVGCVKVKPGCYFGASEVRRWIQCTQPGGGIYEPWLENDLLWMNQNSFRSVSVDFEKGDQPGTTDVVYSVKDQFPMRGYVGVDNSGVETLNYGRFFAGFQYGNFLGRGGTLGYQYTTDESFSLLQAHSANWNQPINRQYSLMSYGSWATVSPMLGGGLSQDGESFQWGSTLTRTLTRSRTCNRNLTAGVEFKATNNNLEFAGSTISGSVADLFQLRFGYDSFTRHDVDQFRMFKFDVFVGPGGGITSDHTVAAFNSLRPGTSPDYAYARMRYDRTDLIGQSWLLSTKLTGQVASERLLLSESLGLGGYDTIRGLDQRAYNADHGWIANFEFGPKTHRWGCQHAPRTFRGYTFLDMGNGYIDDARAGEDANTFVVSTGVGARLQVSDQLTARFDYGFGLKGIDETTRNDRAHFGLTWIPGRRRM